MHPNFKIGIIPFKAAGKHQVPGSTFLRALGVVNNSENYEMWKHAVKYDGLIFQKNYWKEMMDIYRGPKIVDICDPDWIKSTGDFLGFCKKADAITCSSQELTSYISNVFPKKSVFWVPDRLNFKIFPNIEKHHLGTGSTVIWFGYIHNAHICLKPWLPIIRELNLQLKIISDKDYQNQAELLGIDYTWVKYNQDTIYFELLQSDIILNPKSTKAFFKFKSNNKSIIGWKLGIPVAETTGELLKFLDPIERTMEASLKKGIVDSYYNVQQSVLDYDNIFRMLMSK